MRISDWSSDVCSYDLCIGEEAEPHVQRRVEGGVRRVVNCAEANDDRILVENRDARWPVEFARQRERPGSRGLHHQRVALIAAAQRLRPQRHAISVLAWIL